MNVTANNNELSNDAMPSMNNHNQTNSDLSVETEAELLETSPDVVPVEDGVDKNGDELRNDSLSLTDSHNQLNSAALVATEAEPKTDSPAIVKTGYEADEFGIKNKFFYWLELDKWSLTEAVLVIMNVNPRKVFFKNNKFISLMTFQGDWIPSCDEHGEPYPGFEIENQVFYVCGADKLVEYQNQYEDLYRIFSDYNLKSDSPHDWIEYARAKNVVIPWLDFSIQNKLYLPVDPHSKNVNYLTGDTKFDESERLSLLKIVLALANNAYEYPSHGSVGKMLRGFEKHHNGVSENTLAKYLKLATQSLPLSRK